MGSLHVFRWQHIRAARALWLSCCAAMLTLCCSSRVWAQAGDVGGGRSFPSASYFNTFELLYEGEYKDALKGFEAELRGGIKTTQSRWIDSICFYTMVGECHYRMGHLPQALENYNAALQLYMAFPDWMLRVQFPDSIQPARGTFKTVPWGASQRTSKLGHFPATMLIGLGRVSNQQVLEKGGVVQRAILYPVQVQEIVRCTTLSMHRRRELLGPICPHDPMTDQLIATCSRRLVPPNHWSQAWLDVQLGMAYAAGGKSTQAAGLLQKSLLVSGEYNHPLTATALLELGLLALEEGDLPQAAASFQEASFSAFNFPDYGILEEALRWGQLTHMLANQKGVYPPLATAMAWSRTRSTELTASLLISAAENQAVLGQPQAAASLLADSKAAIGRRDLAAFAIGSRMHYVNALVNYQRANIQAGDDALLAAMDFQRAGSKWLFQIALADNLVTSSDALTPRVAVQMYETLLRDPNASDWGLRPLECLAVLMTPHPGPLERWFEAAMVRKEYEAALVIADRARRHRFFSSLPLGGRALALRWILEAPENLLSQQAVLQRQDLLVRYPKYAEAAAQARQLRASLQRGTLVTDNAADFKQLSNQLSQLGRLSLTQEAMLREIAVRREPAEMVFPPLRPTAEIQKELPDGHLMLVFFATSRNLYGFLLGNKQYSFWQVASPADVEKRTATLLKAFGNFDANRELTTAQLADEAWRQSARELLQSLLAGSKVNLAEGIQELVIVPDGFLWYLPFEALQLPAGGGARSLLSVARIRYAPTMSLGIPARHGRKAGGNIAVAVGKLFPRDDPAVMQAAYEQLASAVPGAIALKSPLPAASPLYKTLFDGLIVLDDLAMGEGAYDWSPLPLDKTRPAGVLANWFALPWGGPDQVILPGFHTAAEAGMRRTGAAVAGHDLFLAACGMMSTGTRTILLSRWRTGGQSSVDLVREFAQELPYSTAAEAWQRSVDLVRQAPLVLELEPRIKKASQGQPTAAGHPFFWSGYMLIDSGALPQKQEELQPAMKLDPAAVKK